MSTGITLVLSTLGMDTAAESASLEASLLLLQANKRIHKIPVTQATIKNLYTKGFIWQVFIVLIEYLQERIVPTLTFVGRYFPVDMKHILQVIQEDQILKVCIALLIGTVLGLEREYKRKAAGMRTMTLICVSSAIFTILSAELGYPNSPDRVASNILTGVGFIGAGVIFKNDYTIDGITTAASIWIAAALGMAVGMSQYVLAVGGLAGALIVLILMEFTEKSIAEVNDKRYYIIYFHEDKFQEVDIEHILRNFGLKYKRMFIVRKADLIELSYTVRGNRSKMEQLDEFLLQNKSITEFQIQLNPF